MSSQENEMWWCGRVECGGETDIGGLSRLVTKILSMNDVCFLHACSSTNTRKSSNGPQKCVSITPIGEF